MPNERSKRTKIENGYFVDRQGMYLKIDQQHLFYCRGAKQFHLSLSNVVFLLKRTTGVSELFASLSVVHCFDGLFGRSSLYEVSRYTIRSSSLFR